MQGLLDWQRGVHPVGRVVCPSSASSLPARIAPMNAEPSQQNVITMGVCELEKRNVKTMSGLFNVPSLFSEQNRYRAPKQGEVVEIVGLRSRQELNGMIGEIVSSCSDDCGRVTVRTSDTSGAGSIDVRIQPRCLRFRGSADRIQEAMRKFQSGSTPSLHGSSVASSVRSARSGRGRGLGSAISAGAKGMMSPARPAPATPSEDMDPPLPENLCETRPLLNFARLKFPSWHHGMTKPM